MLSADPSWRVSPLNDGPGDSVLEFPVPGSPRRLSVAETNEAPQISQDRREGWFLKVHLGHSTEVPTGSGIGSGCGAIAVSISGAFEIFCGTGARGELCLLVMAAIAAFTTCTRGGFMPHARQGGSGVCAFAVAGSKFDGTGLENEHIGQIHVALAAGAGAADGATERKGLPCRGGGVAVALADGVSVAKLEGPRLDSECRLDGF